jgi:uncharacterized protein YcbK (DUF882 family)
MSWWNGIKYFKSSEFDSPDKFDSGKLMRREFVQILDNLRAHCSFPFHITSGYRTREHNIEEGGTNNSAHLRGWAADILVIGNRNRFTLLRGAFTFGISRIGVGKNFIHLDTDPSLPPNTIWTY